MPFVLGDLIGLRPFVYHLTARANLSRIRLTGQLESAAALMKCADRLDLLQVRRAGPIEIVVDGSAVILRDQTPLHAGHIAFENDWKLQQLIESLNKRVFFWPGKPMGPIPHGRRHFKRYATEKPAILRVRLKDLMDANPSKEPLFCAYNSGSPRTTDGKKSPRGPRTFLPCREFPRNCGKVVEVTFKEAVALPAATEVRLLAEVGWRSLATFDTEAHGSASVQ